MAEKVNTGRRRYESPRRREQSAATRRHILEVAQPLFEQQGFAATTMAQIASKARLALKTLYLAFETKGGLLCALWYLRVRGDEQDVPVGDRAWYRAVLDEPEPREQVRLVAHNSRMIKERAAALMGVIRDGARTDPDVQELWSGIEIEFYANQKAIVESLHAKGALREGLDVARGADILWTLNHPELWKLLVGARGWSAAEFEQWFGDTVIAQLLKPQQRAIKRSHGAQAPHSC